MFENVATFLFPSKWHIILVSSYNSHWARANLP